MISKDQEDEKAVNARMKRRNQRQKAQVQGDDQQAFYQNFQNNPNQALNNVSKKMKRNQKTLQKQIDYFGHVIQPFNMNDQQGMGDIDNEGFFVFKKDNNVVKDAWLDSLEIGNDQQFIKGIQKRVLQGKREGKDDQNSKLKKKRRLDDGQSKQIVHHQLSPEQIKFIINELLPTGITCASYMNKIKPKKSTTIKKKNVRKNAPIATQIQQGNAQQYQKILTLVQEYIQQTGDHSIMQYKKQNQSEIQQKQQKQKQQLQMTEKDNTNLNDSNKKDQKDEDDIF